MLYLACIFPSSIKKITPNINDHSVSDFKISASKWEDWAKYKKKKRKWKWKDNHNDCMFMLSDRENNSWLWGLRTCREQWRLALLIASLTKRRLLGTADCCHGNLTLRWNLETSTPILGSSWEDPCKPHITYFSVKSEAWSFAFHLVSFCAG